MSNITTHQDRPIEASADRNRSLEVVIAGGKRSVLVGLAIAIAPVYAHAQKAQPQYSMPMVSAPAPNYYGGSKDPGFSCPGSTW